MKKQSLKRVQHIYLYKRLPENLVPWKVLKKSTKQTQRTNQTKKAVGLPLLLKKGARGIHQKKVALKFAPSLKIDVLERGSLVSTPCSLKVWANNANRLSCSLKREKKGTTKKMFPSLPCEVFTPSGADQRSAIPFDATNHRFDERYQILSNHSKVISNYTGGRASLLASLREAQTRRGSAKQLLGIEGVVSNKSKPLSSFKWRKGASLYSCFQLEGSLSKQQEKRSSPFLLQLLERKKLRILYGNLSNREINVVIKQAKINRGGLGDNIFRLLESRLDVVLCKIGFSTTISFARQWVYHGKVQVNSKVLTIANYNLQPGDVISISPPHCQFLKTQINALLGRHMVERAATSIIDHHNLSKARTPKGQGATNNLRSLAISFSKAWLGWENNRSSLFNPLNGSSLMINEVDHRLSMDQRKKLRFFLLKLTHVEVSFRLFTAVYLYSPQRILLPATIDIEKIRKSQTA